MYTNFSLHVTNTLVLLIAINLLTLGLSESCSPGHSTNAVAKKYHVDLGIYYPGMSQSDINTLLQETWNRSLTFEPFTQFTEPVTEGRFVNVVRDGYRLGKEPTPWPLDESYFNVFFLGGSTGFGVGLPDAETIPSALQDFLNQRSRSKPARVYNFARSHYYSSQERALFVQLLVKGAVPDAVIFFDGLNDFYYHHDIPNFTEQFRSLTDGKFSKFGSAMYAALRVMPIARELEESSLFAKVNAKTPRGPGDHSVVDTVLARYEVNQKLIRILADAFHVKPLFVWQPVPTYGYDLSKHVFSRDGFGPHVSSGPGYEQIKQRHFASRDAPDFIWCADAHQKAPWPHYLDSVHYTASMSKAIAACIVEQTRGELSVARR